MNFYVCLTLATVCWTGINACEHYGDEKCLDIKPIEGRHFLNQWIVEIHGDEETARIVAKETGFEFMEPVGIIRTVVKSLIFLKINSNLIRFEKILNKYIPRA